MTAEEIINVGKKIQENDIDTLDKIINTNERSKEVAANTMAKLHGQTEQLRFYFLLSFNDFKEKLMKDWKTFRRTSKWQRNN